MTQNQIKYQELLELQRSNKVNEAERERANKALESQRASEIAETTRHNIVWESESQRHNQATESETHRSNLADELERNRHNLATEDLSQQQVNYGYATLGESQRHNLAQEQIGSTQALASMLNTPAGTAAVVASATRPVQFNPSKVVRINPTIRPANTPTRKVNREIGVGSRVSSARRTASSSKSNIRRRK
nr:putative ORF1 [Marmot picobirnavirus]